MITASKAIAATCLSPELLESTVALCSRQISMGVTKNLAESLHDKTLEMLPGVDNDASKLPEPHKTIAVTYAAQSIIDYGGFISME